MLDYPDSIAYSYTGLNCLWVKLPQSEKELEGSARYTFTPFGPCFSISSTMAAARSTAKIRSAVSFNCKDNPQDFEKESQTSFGR